MKNIYRKFLLVILVVFFQFVKAQENLYTNVQLQKWQDNYLNVETFQNGDLIEVCADTNSWKALNNKNRSAVFVTNQGDHYYNYFAISDTRGLCPNGFRVPYYWEISDSKVDLIVTNKLAIDGEFDLRLYPKGSLDNSDGALRVLNKSSNSVYIATRSLYEADPNYYFLTAHITKNDYVDIIDWPFPKNSGLPVVCYLDIDATISESIFDYKKLLPDVYNSIIDKMYSNMRSQFDINSDFAVLVNANINCSRLGNIEYNLTLLKAANEEKLKKTLVSALAEWNTVPYYHGNILMAKSDMQLTFKREVKPLKQSSLFKLNNVRSHTIDKDTLSTLISKGFKCKTSVENILITDNKEIVKKQITTTVNEFKAPSIYNSGLFIIPGLGLTTTHRNSESYKWKKIGKSFLISSISIGAISLSSKIYSNFYYSRYRNDPTGINVTSEYKKANFSQKVFLSTLGAYALLGAVDFIFTFGVSMKNKKYEKIINKQLKVGYEVILK